MSVFKKKQEAVRSVISKGNIFKTHPNLYISITIMAVMFIALAINFFSFKPTFSPYGLSNHLIGAVFLTLGIGKLVFLNLYRNLKLVRIIIAVGMAFLLFWGISNTQQAFAGKASFQLPILLVSLAALQFPLLVEPTVNPITKIAKDKND